MTGSGIPLPRRGEAGDSRATRAEIDLDVLQRNVEILRATLTPGTEMMAVVKANAYGHGARMVAQVALSAGASQLGVATVGEGLQLRTGGIQAPILILSPISAAEAPLAIKHGLDLTIGTDELLAAVVEASSAAPSRVGVHVKVDSGMHRYGAEPQLARSLANRVAATPSLRLAGLMTHFAAADDPDERFTIEQRELFERCLSELADLGIEPELRHMANSAAALRKHRYQADMVRFGIAMYGLQPSPTIKLPPGVMPVMSVYSAVSRVHRVAPPTSVGYGRTYTPPSVEQVALIPIGYADGYRRGLSNQAWMMIGDHRADVVGRISMDQTVVRLPAGAPVKVGDDVVVFGGASGLAPSADHLADLLGTISYEIVSGLAARVPRHYLRDGQTVAIEGLPLT